MAEEFKIGDIVELKSGGPKMTVTEVNVPDVINTANRLVGTTWFTGGKKLSDYFPYDAIKKAEDGQMFTKVDLDKYK